MLLFLYDQKKNTTGSPRNYSAGRISVTITFDCLESRVYKDFTDLRQFFPSVDRVRLKTGQERYVFNVAGNNYRVICGIHFNRGKVYVRFVLTHAEYDKGAWKNE